MNDRDNRWALVLAAGDGRRLHRLTTTAAGVAVPKQFCSLEGGASLLHEALARAEAAAPRGQICTIVAEQHRHFWSQQLDRLPGRNVIVQPQNRGTANGILLPLLHIVERDVDARVMLLPSDHHVRDEATLARSLRAASISAPTPEAVRAEILLLGFEPREPDPELGYILPGQSQKSGHRTVERFVEKPPAAFARELIGHGGLWNAFIIAADARALLGLFEYRCPEIVAEMQRVVRRATRGQHDPNALAELYAGLPELDFSRHILQGQERHLRVLAVPECGWSDLGTPQRVADAVQEPRPPPAAAATTASGLLSLAAQHQCLSAFGSGTWIAGA